MEIEFTNITQILEMLEETAPEVYGIYVRQAIVAGYVNLIWSGVALFFAILCFRVLFHTYGEYKKRKIVVDELNAAVRKQDSWSVRQLDMWTGEGMIFSVIFLTFFGLACLSWFFFQIGISYKMVANPEYYAVKELLQNISGIAR